MLRPDMPTPDAIMKKNHWGRDECRVKIYGDVLAAVNFTVTLMILQLCGRILGVRPGRVAKYLSASLGAAASFIIFVPISSVALQLLYRLAVSVLLVGTAFPALTKRAYLRAIGVFYLVSILFAGVTMLLVWLRPSSGFYTANGVVYYNIRPVLLLACLAAAYAVVTLYDRFTAKRTPSREIYRIVIARNGRTLPVLALADSGNRLVEPFSGLPVLVVNAAEVWGLLSPEERRIIREHDTETPLPGLRWVLAGTVQGRGMLPAFRPDEMYIMLEKKKAELSGYFAVTVEANIGNGDYGGIFNPKMIQVLL